jgi:hypothetical protein
MKYTHFYRYIPRNEVRSARPLTIQQKYKKGHAPSYEPNFFIRLPLVQQPVRGKESLFSLLIRMTLLLKPRHAALWRTEGRHARAEGVQGCEYGQSSILVLKL